MTSGPRLRLQAAAAGQNRRGGEKGDPLWLRGWERLTSFIQLTLKEETTQGTAEMKAVLSLCALLAAASAASPKTPHIIHIIADVRWALVMERRGENMWERDCGETGVDRPEAYPHDRSF